MRDFDGAETGLEKRRENSYSLGKFQRELSEEKKCIYIILEVSGKVIIYAILVQSSSWE